MPLNVPEALVDAVDRTRAGSPPRRFVRDEAVRHDQRRRGMPALIPHGYLRRARRERTPVDGDDVLGAAEPADRDIAQAAAHRVADEQRAGEHRHRRRHAQHDGQVRAPVIGLRFGERAAEVMRSDACSVFSARRPSRSGRETARRARRCASRRPGSSARARASPAAAAATASAARDRGCRSARRRAARSGFRISARATAARCFSPPESSPDDDRADRPGRPASSNSRRARLVLARHRVSSGRRHQRRRQHVLEHRTLRQQRVILEHEADAAGCEMPPARARSSANGSCPSSVTVPDVGGSSAPRM